jgi:deoxyhypusine synthase
MTAEPSATTSDAHGSVLTPSEALPSDSIHVKGPNFDSEIGLQELLTGYETIGFQATGLARAIKIVNRMVSRHLASSDLQVLTLKSRQLALD